MAGKAPWASCCIVMAMAAPALSADFGLRVGGAYSDNAERTSVDEESSTAAVVGIDLNAERETGRLLYDVEGDLEYMDFQEDGIESQEYGQLIATSSYAIVPESFDWLLSGSFDQVREDLLRPSAPGNLEEVITASTGPSWRLNFGDAYEAQTEAHYAIAEYSEREFDSDTLGGSLAFGRRLSERTFVGIGGRFDDVSYTSDTGFSAPDFDRKEYFLRFNTEAARTDLEAELGYAEVSGGLVEDDGLMSRIRATRRLTPYVSGYVGYTREFPTSEGATFSRRDVVAGVTDDASVLTGGPRQAQSTEIGLQMIRPRTTGVLSYIRRSETELIAAGLDRDYDEIHASLTRLVTTRSSISIYGLFADERLGALGGDSEEISAGAEINIAIGRTMGLDLRVQHRERSSDSGVGEYTELSGGVFLRYGSARRFVPTAPL